MSNYANVTPEHRNRLAEALHSNPKALILYLAEKLAAQCEHYAEAYNPDEHTIDHDSGQEIFCDSLSLKDEADWVLELLGTSLEQLQADFIARVLANNPVIASDLDDGPEVPFPS